MFKRALTTSLLATVLLASAARADVFSMPGSLKSITFVPVGNPGNAGQLTGESVPQGGGPDRISGAVSYNYNIGKHEVTAGHYTAFLNAVAKTDTHELYSTAMADPSGARGCNIQRTGSPGSYVYTVAADYANRPVNYVSWGDCARFVNWVANGQPTGIQNLSSTENGTYFLNGVNSESTLITVTRKAGAIYALPSEDEWHKAAFHKNDGATGNYWKYATRSDTYPANAVLPTDPGNNANFSSNNVYAIGDPYYRNEVGEYENSPSPYGTFDQDGNVWEFNESVLFGNEFGLRGGSFFEGGGGAQNGSSGARYHTSPTYGNDRIGFRLSQVPEPTSLTLILAAATSLLTRRRPRERHAN
jgi:sulfatase modifying factor 1